MPVATRKKNQNNHRELSSVARKTCGLEGRRLLRWDIVFPDGETPRTDCRAEIGIEI